MTVKSEAVEKLEGLLIEMLGQSGNVNDTLANGMITEPAALSFMTAFNINQKLAANIVAALDLVKDITAPVLN